MSSSSQDLLKIVIVGHVDHGKSTVVGRLLHDTDSLPPGKIDAIRTVSEKRGMPFEWSFLLDALQAERDQGVTIDTTQIWLRTPRRDTVIIDAPGHKEFLRNMITGAAQADAALLVIDAKEGVREQSRRHGYLLHLLGIRQLMVAVNKMDTVGFDEIRFEEIRQEIEEYLLSLRMSASAILPIVARDGDNVAKRSSRMSWYTGQTVLEGIGEFRPLAAAINQPLRFPVQDVYKFDERRILVGRVESGVLRVGDRILFSPQNRSARVSAIEVWNESRSEATAGESIGVSLDEQLFVERGALGSHVASPPTETEVFKSRIFWFSRRPLLVGQSYKIKLHTNEAVVTVQSIENIVDTNDLSLLFSQSVEQSAVADVTFRASTMLALDDHADGARTGRFVLVDGCDIVGGGTVSMEGFADQRSLIAARATNVQRVELRVSSSDRRQRNRHGGGVLWMTGLSGAGKSTLAVELERRLFGLGYQVYTLDGDNLRFGLNADLGFSPEDRAENIRRVGEVAGLFAEAGLIVVSAFISPYIADRDRARKVSRNRFHEFYISADLPTCEKRDPKGLYKKARAGEIPNFTGVSAPYEVPTDPELVVDSSVASIDECVERMIAYVRRSFPMADA